MINDLTVLVLLNQNLIPTLFNFKFFASIGVDLIDHTLDV